jgi:hypothetical protein
MPSSLAPFFEDDTTLPECDQGPYVLWAAIHYAALQHREKYRLLYAENKVF